MAIAFRASSGFSNVADPPATSMTLTIASAVASGDWVWVWLNVADNSNAAFPTVVLTSTATAPVQVGTDLQGSSHTVGQLWQIHAGSGDAGATLTATATVSSNPRQCFFGGAGAAWSGAATVQNGNFALGTGASSTTATAPSTTTTAAGSWAVGTASLIGGAAFAAAGTVQQSGYTIRVTDADNQRAIITDTAASVGGSGTSIGGGTWTGAGVGPWIMAEFEILAPAAAAAGESPYVISQNTGFF